MSSLRIIFMGTPEFAVPSLEILIENKCNVVAVITAPDKPQGRGQNLTPSPVYTGIITPLSTSLNSHSNSQIYRCIS